MKETNVLRRAEQVSLTLRGIYEQFGYRRFRVSKFEEYDFYATYRSFLQTESILTFHDLNGKLMALKPDVTLSIIKNAPQAPKRPERVYYSEAVYRAAKGARTFAEMQQLGLEFVGEVDRYALVEVLLLADKSMAAMGGPYTLDLSHVGLLECLLGEAGLSGRAREGCYEAVFSKNLQRLEELLASSPAAVRQALLALVSAYGPANEVLKSLRGLCFAGAAQAEFEALCGLCAALEAAGVGLHLDFTLRYDPSYYSGVIFQGYLPRVQGCVLSGGQYDGLLQRFGKSGGAVGFAVYLGLLEEQYAEERPYDVDTLLLYSESTGMAELLSAVRVLTAEGKSVCVQKTDDGTVRCRQVATISEGRLTSVVRVD